MIGGNYYGHEGEISYPVTFYTGRNPGATQISWTARLMTSQPCFDGSWQPM